MIIKEVQNNLDRLTELYQDEVYPMTIEQLNKKVDKKTWTINQVLNHLVKINSSYFPIFEQVSKGKYSTPILGNIGFYAKYLGKSILKSVRPENKKKIKTAQIWTPKKESFDESQIYDFMKIQESLKNHIEEMEKWIARDIVIHSPMSRNLVYPITDALNIIVTHEERHLDQLKRIKAEVLS